MRILVPSSDKTGWMCRAMLYLLDKHWPAHPPVVVGGYTRPELPPNVEFYKIGEWADYPVNRWSDGVIRFIQAMPDDVFCWTMDDFWLIQDVDQHVISYCETLISELTGISRIDLTDDRLMSGGAVPWSGPPVEPAVDMVITAFNTPYQLSFQTGLWRRSELLKYLVPGETPAESEIRGASRMSRAGAIVLGTKQAPIRYLIAMQHGSLHIDDPGYQAPGTALLPEDRAELARLGYLSPPALAPIVGQV